MLIQIFLKAFHGNDTITTLFLNADTSADNATDQIQIFVEDDEIRTRPYDFGTDAIERMRVAQPESMLDADFEYGLQPTKWQAIATQRGYPSIYEVPGTDFDIANCNIRCFSRYTRYWFIFNHSYNNWPTQF